MNRRFAALPLLVNISAWILLVMLAIDWLAGRLTVNPIQAIMQRTGNIALIYLVLSLACTPVNTLFRFSPVVQVRRVLGLYGWMYAALHFLVFIGLDYGFDLELIGQAILEKRFIIAGLFALVVLSVLALTSFRWWMARMGKRWKSLHRLVYLADVMVVLHFAWAVKGDIFLLRGDVFRPLLAGSVVVLLLVLRTRLVRKWLSGRHLRSRQQLPSPPEQNEPARR